jgi:hypothetical protein
MNKDSHPAAQALNGFVGGCGSTIDTRHKLADWGNGNNGRPSSCGKPPVDPAGVWEALV